MLMDHILSHHPVMFGFVVSVCLFSFFFPTYPTALHLWTVELSSVRLTPFQNWESSELKGLSRCLTTIWHLNVIPSDCFLPSVISMFFFSSKTYLSTPFVFTNQSPMKFVLWIVWVNKMSRRQTTASLIAGLIACFPGLRILLEKSP